MHFNEKIVTLDEYMAMPIGAPYQYINGRLIDWPSRTVTHQLVLNGVLLSFSNYDDENGGTCLIGPMETILDDQNSFQPDFIYIAAEREHIIKDYIYGPPNFVVEILEPVNAYYDLRPKKDIYEKYGVDEYMLIDPFQMNADLYVLKNGSYYLDQRAVEGQHLYSRMLPNLVFDMDKVFSNLRQFFKR